MHSPSPPKKYLFYVHYSIQTRYEKVHNAIYGRLVPEAHCHKALDIEHQKPNKMGVLLVEMPPPQNSKCVSFPREVLIVHVLIQGIVFKIFAISIQCDRQGTIAPNKCRNKQFFTDIASVHMCLHLLHQSMKSYMDASRM